MFFFFFFFDTVTRIIVPGGGVVLDCTVFRDGSNNLTPSCKCK